MVSEGTRNIRRLVELFKLGTIDYLKICNLGNKIFKSFDTDCNGLLDTNEMAMFIDAVLHEINFASKKLSKAEHKALFREFDSDGGGSVN